MTPCEKCPESSRIILSSGTTRKSDTEKALFAANDPGKSRENQGCVTTKERSEENLITAAMNVGKYS